jgi:hypothetical protein
MESLADYRAKHAVEYQKRLEEENAKAQRIEAELAEKLAEEQRVLAFNNAFIANIESCATKLLVCHHTMHMLEILLDLDSNIDTHIDKFKNVNNVNNVNNMNPNNQNMMKQIVDAVLKVFESVNNNTSAKINFNDREEINTSKCIQQTMKAILGKVGIQHEDENLEVNYEMDCTQDEEFAQQLYLEEQQRVNNHVPPPLLHNIPNIPNIPNAPLPNRRQRRAASVNIPRVHVDPREDGIPPTPRGRGRPRRNQQQNQNNIDIN